MKKSFTSTCQSFLMHSMLTLMTAQATHATEPLIHMVNALQHCDTLQEAKNVGENTTKNLIHEANDSFNKGIEHAAKNNEEGNKAAANAFNEAISTYQALGGHEKDIVSASCKLAAVRINMKKSEYALYIARRVLGLYGNVTTEPIHLIPSFNQLARICYDFKENNLAIQYYLRVINLCDIERSCADEKINAYFHVGDLYIKEGNLKGAIEYYEKVIQEAKPKSRIVAHAQNQVGNIYTGKPYVNYKKAEQSYLSALSIYEKGDNNFFLAETKLNLAILYLDKQKDYDKAIKNFNEAIDYYSKGDTENRKNKRKIAASYFKLANAYQVQQKYKQAIVAFNKAIFCYTELGDVLTEAKAKFNIALCYEKNEQHSLAEATYKKAKELFEKEKEGAAYAAQCDKKLGDLYYMQEGREKETLHHYTAFYEAYKASDHVSKKICAIERLVQVYLKLSNHEKIIELQKEALEILSNKYGKNSLKVAELYDDLAMFYLGQKKTKRAYDMYKKVLAIRKEKFDDNAPELARNYMMMGEVCFYNGLYDESIEFYNKAIQIFGKIESMRLDKAKAYNSRGSAYTEKKLYNKAIKDYKKAKIIFTKKLGAESEGVAVTCKLLGHCYNAKSEYQNAIESFNTALKIHQKLDKIHQKPHALKAEIANDYYEIGVCYSYSKKKNKYIYAIKNHNEALTKLKEYYRGEHMEVAYKCTDIGEIYSSLKQYKLAAPFYERSLKIREKHREKIKPLDLKKGYLSMGLNSYHLKKYEDVIKYVPKYLKIQQETYPDELNVDTISFLGILADSYFAKKKYKDAIDYGQKTIDMIRLSEFQNAPEMKKKEASLLCKMCRVECCQNKFTDALNHCQEALEIHERVFGLKDEKVASDLYCMGMIYKNQAFLQLDEVEDCYDKAIFCLEEAEKIYIVKSLFDLSKKCKEEIEKLKKNQNCLKTMSLFMKGKISPKLVFQD